MLQHPMLSLIQFLLLVVLLLSQTAIAAPPEPLVKAPQVDTLIRL